MVHRRSLEPHRRDLRGTAAATSGPRCADRYCRRTAGRRGRLSLAVVHDRHAGSARFGVASRLDGRCARDPHRELAESSWRVEPSSWRRPPPRSGVASSGASTGARRCARRCSGSSTPRPPAAGRVDRGAHLRAFVREVDGEPIPRDPATAARPRRAAAARSPPTGWRAGRRPRSWPGSSSPGRDVKAATRQPEGDVAAGPGLRARPAGRVDGLRGRGRGLLRALRRDRCRVLTEVTRELARATPARRRPPRAPAARQPLDQAHGAHPAAAPAGPRASGPPTRPAACAPLLRLARELGRPRPPRHGGLRQPRDAAPGLRGGAGRARSSADAPSVGVVVQAYLRDADETLERILVLPGARPAASVPPTIRLVKGAYWDHESVIAGQRGWEAPVWTEKRETDACFERLTRRPGRRARRGSPGDRHPQPALAGPRDRLPGAGAAARPPELELQVLRGLGDELAEGVCQARLPGPDLHADRRPRGRDGLSRPAAAGELLQRGLPAAASATSRSTSCSRRRRA